MAALFRKLELVLWKNILIRRRHYIVTFFEISVPLFLFAIIAIVASNISLPDTSSYVNTTYFPITTKHNLVNHLHPDTKVLYSPKDSKIEELMKRVQKQLSIKEMKGFDNEKELVKYYSLTSNETSDKVFGIVFENTSGNQLKYKIRPGSEYTWSTNIIYPESNDMFSFHSSNSDIYFGSGFLAIQYAVDVSYIESVKPVNVSSLFKLSLQEFPYPAYTNDVSIQQIYAILLPFFTVISFVMLCPAILKRVVEEKQTGAKELMKMMGLEKWMLWVGWLINALLVGVITITIIVILLTIPLNDSGSKVIEHSDPILLWVFFLLYFTASVMLCFAMSTFFERPTIAMSVAICIWFLSFFIPNGYTASVPNIPTYVQVLFCFIPNMAMAKGYEIIFMHEKRDVGITWMNVNEVPYGNNNSLSFLTVIIMLLVDIFIYDFIKWYVDAIMPGKYGLAKPWYFMFMPSFWSSNKIDNGDNLLKDSLNNKNFEAPPAGLPVGIRVENLRKVFSSFGGYKRKVAVDNVSLDIYRDQITALLGHNGAGKTTTMSIITGIFSPTNGSVFINGYDIKHNLSKVRESLGLCPQHSLLFPDLTVFEHLLFFGRLKGCSKKEVHGEANILLERLNLSSKKNVNPNTLSGGMKRKLSLGIALIGNSKVIILDEPTSGLDPEARREIWDLLLSMRGERTILITTHFMEEADVLGDRIAIMDHGRVYCYGTSLFLKKLYGTGYNLKLLTNELCMVSKITTLVQSIIPNSHVKSETGLEICYSLPSEYTQLYPQLFDSLEEQKTQLGITAIGMSLTTLEEVFLKVGEEAGEEYKKTVPNSYNDEDLVSIDCEEEVTQMIRNEGFNLFIQQLNALFVKKVIYSQRKWLLLLLKVLIPVLMTILTIRLSVTNSYEPDIDNPRTFSLHDYRYSTVPFTVQAGVPKKIEDIYGKIVGSKPLPSNTTVSAEVLKIGEDVNRYRDELVIGAEFNKSSAVASETSVNAMYSSVYYHAAPVSLNIITNSLLKYLQSEEYSITTTNHPFTHTGHAEHSQNMSEGKVMPIWLTFIPMGLLFLVGMFMIYPLIERVTCAKQLQLMTGVSPPSYWVTCFSWDFTVYFLVSVLMLICVFIFDTSGMFKGQQEAGVFMLLLVLYGFSGITCSYVFSYFKRTPAGGFGLFVIINLLSGLILSSVVNAFELINVAKYDRASKGIKYSFFLLPHFAFSFALMHFSMQVVRNNMCNMMDDNYLKGECSARPHHRCCLPTSSKVYPYLEYSSKDNAFGIGLEVTYLALDTLLYVIIIMLIDYGVIGSLYEYVLKLIFSKSAKSDMLDNDVADEQDRVDGQVRDYVTCMQSRKLSHYHYDPNPAEPVVDLEVYYKLLPTKNENCDPPVQYLPMQDQRTADDVLLVQNLSKKYGWRFSAVKGISFGVGYGECFGLLGVNGAGKTTTFKMLTGAERPTEGDAFLQQFSLRKDRYQFFSNLGYCPQFDAFNETLTGREVLQLFAHLRGVPKNQISTEVNKWLHLLGLNEYEKRVSGTYSGGNKRKLSTAMALVGNPPVVLLDEPTSGVDPIARRNLWTTLSNIQNTGQAIVLTSHSMEECEALCNRLAIMVNGQFQCIGNIQYLKQKFGQGFTIMIKLKVTDVDTEYLQRLKDAMEEAFNSQCVIKDEHVGLLHYHITDSNVSWKYLFTTMENLKKTSPIVEDYTISETTLEQVFLSFAKAQK